MWFLSYIYPWFAIRQWYWHFLTSRVPFLPWQMRSSTRVGMSDKREQLSQNHFVLEEENRVKTIIRSRYFLRLWHICGKPRFVGMPFPINETSAQASLLNHWSKYKFYTKREVCQRFQLEQRRNSQALQTLNRVLFGTLKLNFHLQREKGYENPFKMDALTFIAHIHPLKI